MENPSFESSVALGKLPVHDVPSRVVSFQTLPLLVGGTVFLIMLKFVATAFYNVYLHPLRNYPGPQYAIMSGLAYWIISYQGNLTHWTRKQHNIYGEVVRIGPDRLSYICAQAWKDIYGHRTGGRKENPKDKRFYTKEINGEDHLLTVESTSEHSRLRRIFSHAFSDRALKLQEPLTKKYVDQLIDNIRGLANKNADVDLVKLYNCTTFDVMGDLTFGEPLGMLESSSYTPWVKAVFDGVKKGDLSRIQTEYPWIGLLMKVFTPKSLYEQQKKHFQHSVERVDRRLEKGIDGGGDKPDIWKLVLEKGEGQLSLAQMHANASLFMIAGTETTATLLSGLTYYLLKNPDKLQKAIAEVRAMREDQLTLEQLPHLPYLAACFEEGLRVYPPIPMGSPREVAEGGNAICGEWVPGKTRVSLHQWSAYRSPINFKDPDEFIPERWLPGTGYDSDKKEVLQPFSFGPRNCLGKNLAYHEIRIILAKVLWHFDLELCTQSKNWADQRAWSFWQKPELWCKAKIIH